MPKSTNQKGKMLYILRILGEYTDENHILTADQIIDKLAACDISAERKSIYADIECLRDLGYEIILKKNPTGYYLKNREFSLPELKVLVDVVQSSKFISKNKSNELIKKLQKFTNKYKASELLRQVYVVDRVKSSNDDIYVNVDYIQKAITNNRQIIFKYLEWTKNKKLEPRKNGKDYVVSPISLVWNDENYYLVAVSHEDLKVKHYRVDKMGKIKISEEKRVIGEEDKKFDQAIFSKKTFGMYGGSEVNLSMIIDESMIGVMIDRFGTEIPLMPMKDGKFKSHIKVNVSGQFFGWITGLGGKVKIVEPENVVEQYREYLKSILDEL